MSRQAGARSSRVKATPSPRSLQKLERRRAAERFALEHPLVTNQSSYELGVRLCGIGFCSEHDGWNIVSLRREWDKGKAIYVAPQPEPSYSSEGNWSYIKYKWFFSQELLHLVGEPLYFVTDAKASQRLRLDSFEVFSHHEKREYLIGQLDQISTRCESGGDLAVTIANNIVGMYKISLQKNDDGLSVIYEFRSPIQQSS